VPDIRWSRRDIKSVGLLAQALAKTEAKARGADDAWLVAPDGFVTEGASSNAWIVTKDGEIITRALSNMILAGITRHALFDSLTTGSQDNRTQLHAGRSEERRRSFRHRRNRPCYARDRD
jgi:branched-subunit amino acid aminotransferase/4-amino-4-deoxychorismate lyase